LWASIGTKDLPLWKSYTSKRWRLNASQWRRWDRSLAAPQSIQFFAPVAATAKKLWHAGTRGINFDDLAAKLRRARRATLFLKSWNESISVLGSSSGLTRKAGKDNASALD
jgi:hypothetical protein